MHYFDSYPLKSRLRNVHPSYKLGVFGLFTLMALCAQSAVILMFILIIHLVGTLIWARISILKLLKLMVIPIGFVMMGSLSVAFDLNPTNPIFHSEIFGISWGITKVCLDRSIYIFLRSLASISILYFFILNTSINDLIHQLRKLRTPTILLELMILVYRNIFIFSDCAKDIQTSQRCRLGYKDFSTSMRSMGLLGGRVFVLANVRADHLYRSMESRCYSGSIGSISRDWKQNLRFICISLIAILITIISLLFVVK